MMRIMARRTKAANDPYGEFELIEANRLHREGKTTAAMVELARAEERPRANKHNIRFLRCIWQIDAGDFSGLDEALIHANGVGRSDEALHLKARAAKMRGAMKEAHQILQRIKKPNHLDLQLKVSVIDGIIRSGDCAQDERVQLQRELDEALVLARRVTAES